jgi:electron transport complex protein RnfD
MVFAIEKAPHLAAARTTRKIMMEFEACLFLVFLRAVIWYFVKLGADYGIRCILIFLVSVGTSVVCDALWNLSKLRDKKDPSRFKTWIRATFDSYGFVTGTDLAMLLPVGGTLKILFIAFVGAIIATFCAKCLFGGFGKNVFNPAIVGRVFVQLCFASDLKTYFAYDAAGQAVAAPTTIAAGASITTFSANLGWTSNLQGISLLDLFLGNYRGTIGETCALALIILGIYLSVRKIIDWRIPVTFLLTFFLTALFIGVGSGLGSASFEFALRQIMLGGVLFGGIICLTDPVTAPTSRAGKMIEAALCALIVALIRYKAAAVEGVAYSILICNMLTPLIGRIIKDKSNQHLPAKTAAITGVMVLSMIFGGVFGHFNKTSDVYKKGVKRYDADETFYSLVVSSAETADSYTLVTDPVDLGQDAAGLSRGTCLKKINLNMDGNPVSYYELQTENERMYGYSTDKTKTWYVTFGVIIDAKKGAVAYKFIEAKENAAGLEFAQNIKLSAAYPYLPATTADLSLTAEQEVSTEGTLGASTLKSSNTVPAILVAIQGAEIDSGIEITVPSDKPIDHLNAILTAQKLTKVSADALTEVATADLPALNADNVGTVSFEYKGFQVNGKDAAYYEATTSKIWMSEEYSTDYSHIVFGIVVNSDGIVGIKILDEYLIHQGLDALTSLEAAITTSNPYVKGGYTLNVGDETKGSWIGSGTAAEGIVFTGASCDEEITVGLFDGIVDSFKGGK